MLRFIILELKINKRKRGLIRCDQTSKYTFSLDLILFVCNLYSSVFELDFNTVKSHHTEV